eukprot:CAMPEP_0206424122 /NCGR_PEP_ID=MMETSP0324_2-20121206/3053_1 /ASSEMBLY_ACC=CAM_ASM_000836 /TAXON_ID=2866 /ORGANISM="Crypthecodinium cohnii, Strain Seligo" /LENGTH=348 /DNA_ID=CAMNT_0053888743 /DNA_START=209 /DNA_END=1254 /DNA_ORIENTATION=+
MNRWIRSLPSLLGRLARPTANLRLLQEAAPGVAARPLLHGALLSGAVVGALAANGARFCSSPIQMDSGKASRPKQVFIRNGQVFECDFGKSELLKRYLGAYTTARTVDRTSLFAFSQHVTRLINTAQAVWLKEGHSGSEKLQSAEVAQTSLEKLGPEGLKALLRSEICAALAELQHLSKEEASEFQVTIMMTLDTVGPHTPAGRGFDVYTFAQPMPPMPQEVKVMAVCAERDHPTIKDAEWVKVRQGLERWQEEQGANEVVMFDEHGNFTEGLQTNFFAVSGDGGGADSAGRSSAIWLHSEGGDRRLQEKQHPDTVRVSNLGEHADLGGMLHLFDISISKAHLRMGGA